MKRARPGSLRYRYRDLELRAIHYELYFKNLEPWLRQGDPPIYNLGLNLDTSGASRTSGYDQGDTLYLPPSSFSREETESLFDCLGQQADKLRRDFKSAEIKSRTFQSHGDTDRRRSNRRRAPGPCQGSDQRHLRDRPLILIERSGRVLLQTNQTANNPAETVVWGQLIDGSGLRPILKAPRHVQFDGELQDTALLLREPEATTGRKLSDDMLVSWR